MRTQWQVEDSIASEPPLALFESKSEHDPSSRLLNSDSAQQAFLYHYLKTGAAPWWYRGPLSHRQVITTQLSREPMQMTTMLRRLGQLDVVRKRLVWQYFPTPLNEVVKALEPHHHEAIESYAERLIALQQQQRLGSHRPSIARQSWYWILTHLFVERGSLFNTTAFVISTIAKMAAHYQLDYATLLRQMVQAAQGLEQTHPQLPVFIRALLNAEQKLPSKVSELATGSSELDHWQRFKQLLEGRLPAALAGPKTLAEMFAWLVRVDPQRMAIILRRVRDRESVLRQLLETFSEAEKAAVVVALLPDDHAFVLGHIQHSQEVLSVASSSALAAVWKTILTSLLAHTGNALNRHQLVTHSLQQWSQVYDVEYSLLLELLTHTPMNPQIRSTQRRELVSLLAEIRQEQAKQPHGKHNDSKVPSRSLFTHYHQQLRQYLLQGQAVAPDGVAGLLQPSMLLQLLLYRDPDGLATVLRQSWAASHRSPRWLSRLLKLTTSADAPMLIHSLVPRVADWLIPLLTLDMEQGFESGLRWLLRPLHSEWTIQHALTTLTMSSSTLLRTLRRIDYETTSKRLGPTLPDVLHSELQKWLQQQARNQSKDEASLIKKLLQWLREQHPSDSPALATLLRELPPSKSHDLLDALRQDPQGHQLARTLVKQEPKIPVLATWLSTLWFHPDIAPQTLAAMLTRNIRASGLWQGSTTLLEQHIYQQMWLSVLTHAGTDATSDTFWSHLFLGLTRSLAISSQQLLPSFRALGYDVTPVVKTLFLNDSRFQLPTKVTHAALSKSESLPSDVLSKSRLVQKDEAPEPGGERKDKAVLNSEPLSSDLLVAKEPWSIDATGQYLQQPAMAQVLSHWLRYGQAPLWWSSTPSLSLKALLADVLAFAPELLVATLRQEQKQSTHLATVLRRLSYEIDFSALLALMKQQEPGIRPRLTELAHIHQQFAEGLFQNITPAFRDLPCLLLWEHVVQHWLSGNWKALQTQTVLLALYQQLIRRYPQTQQEVTEAFEASFQEHVAQQQLTPVTQLEQLLGPLVPNTKNNPSTSYETPLQEVSLVVTNAGLVILQHFFRMYFSRLKLMDDDGFSSKQNQLDAVHWLQYLATGHQETDEPHLVLNKVLCGLPIRAPVSSGIEVSEQQRKLAESMIKAVIQHWTAIGSSSVSGFRGNWLVRDGLLREDDERWTLEVEKRPYDLLLDRLPFGFSLVNLPWMKKPLYVSWST